MKTIILLLPLLAGCAATSIPQPTMVGGLVVVWEDAVTQSQVKEAHRAIKHITSAFYHDHHIKPDLLTVSIADWLSITDPKGNRASGLYFRKKRLIRAILGRWNTLPSLYHELCHAYFAPIDVDHENPNWDKWNDRAHEINEELLYGR